MPESENRSVILDSVCKSFGEKIVLKNFSLKIPYGSKTVIKGPSGCGKTTLLRILAGLIFPDHGTVTGTQGKKTAVLFQEDRLFPTLTALENVSAVVPGNSKKEVAAKILTALGLGDPENLNSYPAQLSGGMKRRCAIARALAYDADIVLLDEALKGLDAENAENCARVIHSYTADKTVVSVTHLDTSLEKDYQNEVVMPMNTF